MHSLHDIREMNMHRADDVCLPICPCDQLENCWTDLDELWYGHYTIGVYPTIILFRFLQSVILTSQAYKLVRWGQH
jgi:hypothetical protein